MSSQRPKWAERLRFWLTDGQYDKPIMFGARDGNWRWKLADKLEAVGQWALCAWYGHQPVADQCDKPEHDYCGYCQEPMPGLAPRGKEGNLR